MTTPGPSSREFTIPSEQDGTHLVDNLHTAFGTYNTRAVHAKGINPEGRFEPDAGAPPISCAKLFDGANRMTVRLSNVTGFPDIPSNNPNANPRGMAIRFGSVASPVFDIVTHDLHGFPARTAGRFGALLRTIGTSATGVARPTPLDLFLANPPGAKLFLKTQHPAPISYVTTAYFSVNAAIFAGRKGRTLV